MPPKLANDLGQHFDIDIMEIDVQPPKKRWKRRFSQSITCYHMLSLAFLQGFYQLQHFSDFYKGPFPGNHGFFSALAGAGSAGRAGKEVPSWELTHKKNRCWNMVIVIGNLTIIHHNTNNNNIIVIIEGSLEVKLPTIWT